MIDFKGTQLAPDRQGSPPPKVRHDWEEVYFFC